MSREDWLGLWANIPRLEAKRLREQLFMRPDIQLSTEGVYDLILAETESHEQAEKAAQRHMAGILRSGGTPT